MVKRLKEREAQYAAHAPKEKSCKVFVYNSGDEKQAVTIGKNCLDEKLVSMAGGQNIFNDIELEYGQLLNRNVSTMIATSRVISSKSSEKLTELIDSAKLTLSSTPVYGEQDVRMWKYSIEDYLSKAEKDITKNNSLAFYIHANYVLQNALQMSLALNGAYMPQPKYLGKLLEEKDPELFEIWNQYLEADSLRQKITILNRLKER